MTPAKLGGTVQAPFAKEVKAAPPGRPPLTNAQPVAPVAVDESWTVDPAATAAGAPEVIVRAGNGVIARLEPAGQEEMKPAARVKTARIPSGVSNADGIAATLDAVRMKV